MQFTLCSNLFSKYESNCIKVGIAFQQLAKNDSKTILLIKNTYLQKTQRIVMCNTQSSTFIPDSATFFLLISCLFQATVDRSNNVIRITWDASCSVINEAIGYQLGITDKTTGSTSYIKLNPTQNTSLTHVFDKNVKYGTAYEFTVQTDDPNAQRTPKYTVQTLPIPVPAGLTTFLNVNASTHEIAWNVPNKLPSYLQKKVNAQKVQYRCVLEFCNTYWVF